jgi:N-formylmaleamate deformylase
MTDWQSDTISTNGINIHYTRTGGDKPPFVLAHGFSDDGLCWTPVAEALEEDYDVIMPDARGHGRSDAPESGYVLPEMAADLAGVIIGLGLHKAIVLGHSMGGATTLIMAGTYPDLPGAIIIEDAGERNIQSGDDPAVEQRMRESLGRLTALQNMSRDELIEHVRSENPTWPEDELGPWADAKLRFNLRAVERMKGSVDDWEAIVSRITCPALLLTADPERGAIIDEDGEKRLRELIPQLQVVRLDDAGHSVHREQFDQYMDAVRSFLAQGQS